MLTLKRVCGLLSVVLICSLPVISMQNPAANTPERRIDNLRQQFNLAYSAGDAAALAGLFAEDAVLMPPGAPAVVGRTTDIVSQPNWYEGGKATYHSVAMYSTKEGNVPIGGADDRAFPSTATPYLPGDPAAAKLMYAFKVSRNCGQEPNCVRLALDNCSKLTIGPTTVLGLFFRMYLEPATKVGAAMPEILYDRVIKFSPRPPTQQ